jgi:hypothetical protein
VLASAALAALAACTGGDDDASPTPAPSTEATTPSAGGSAAAATTEATPGPADDFASILERIAGSEYRIAYTFTSRAGGEEFTGELIWVRAADGRERFETSSDQAGEEFQLVVITGADGAQVTCFDVGGFQNCFSGDDGPFADIPNPTQIIFENVLDPDSIDGVRETASRRILGIDTTCYEVDAGGGTSEACIAEGDFLLYASWTAANGDGGGFEASEFSTDVSDDDFEPLTTVTS